MKALIYSIIMLATLPAGSMAAIIFNDTFNNGSTIQNPAPADPTANSTGYEDFQQGIPPSASIAPGQLHLQGRVTSTAVTEVQALFTLTPVTLSTVGDYIELTIVFTNTQNILTAGVASSLNIGLYHAAGIKPNLGARLDSTGTGTGGAQTWIGYVGRIFGDGAARMFTRPSQGTGLTNPNQNQDLLFNAVSSSSTYNNPAGVIVNSLVTSFNTGLTAGSVYTADFRITLSDVNTLTISNALYTGESVIPGNALFNHTGTTTESSYLTNSFDGLAFGWRYNNSAAPAANSIDISQITITSNVGGSSPVSPFPITSIHAVPPNGFAITWDSVNGQIYQIESSDSLNPVNWTTNGTVTASAASSSFTNSPIPASVLRRFYRVTAIP